MFFGLGYIFVDKIFDYGHYCHLIVGVNDSSALVDLSDYSLYNTLIWVRILSKDVS